MEKSILLLILISTVSLQYVYGSSSESSAGSNEWPPQGRQENQGSRNSQGMLGRGNDNRVPGQIYSVDEILALHVNYHGYYDGCPPEFHLRPLHHARKLIWFHKNVAARRAAEPLESRDEGIDYHKDHLSVGQIVRERGALMIVTNEPSTKKLILDVMHKEQKLLYKRMRERNPIHPHDYVIPQAWNSEDLVLRLKEGRLETVGKLNVQRMIVTRDGGIEAYQDNDLLAHYLGYDDRHTGKPIYESIALAWNEQWIVPELFPLIDKQPLSG